MRRKLVQISEENEEENGNQWNYSDSMNICHIFYFVDDPQDTNKGNDETYDEYEYGDYVPENYDILEDQDEENDAEPTDELLFADLNVSSKKVLDAQTKFFDGYLDLLDDDDGETEPENPKVDPLSNDQATRLSGLLNTLIGRVNSQRSKSRHVSSNDDDGEHSTWRSTRRPTPKPYTTQQIKKDFQEVDSDLKILKQAMARMISMVGDIHKYVQSNWFKLDEVKKWMEQRN